MSRTLLHVEPDDAEAAIHASVLRDVWPQRFHISRVETAGEAREALVAGGIDCVLFAGPTPAAALPWLISAAPAVPVVVLTDDDEAELGLQIVQLGAQDHLVRGADGYQLGRALIYAIERKRTESRLLADRDRREDELSRLADHDGVTGLPVRRRLIEALELALAQDERHRSGGAVVVVHLETLPADDAALQVAARRLAGRVRRGDILAQIDIQDFAVLIAAGDAAVARTVAEGLLGMLATPDATVGPIAASAGFAVLGGAVERSAEVVLLRARAACSSPDRRDGAPAINGLGAPVGPLLVRASWPERLRAALREGSFTLVAQPITRVEGEEIPRYELLLRLREGSELLLPAKFLPAAEREGLSAEIDGWVLDRAVRMVAARGDAGAPVRLEINLSPASVADETLAPRVAAALARSGADPAHLVLEIPERSVTADTPRARRLAEELRALGCEVALDDIGRGGSSLAYLDHVVFDLLKIDVTLAGDVAQGHARRALVEAVVQIAHASGARTIAEGVADADAAEILRGLGVDYAQGHHFGSPMPLAEATVNLRARPSARCSAPCARSPRRRTPLLPPACSRTRVARSIRRLRSSATVLVVGRRPMATPSARAQPLLLRPSVGYDPDGR